MLKVPGREGVSLSTYMGTGRVRILYSPAELVTLARENRNKQVIFLGIGFETTIPTIAAVYQKAAIMKINNLFLYSAFKTVPQALRILLCDPDRYFDGFLLPGHVSVIIGSGAYSFLEEEGGVPGAIAGFEPVDMLRGILSILKFRSKGRLGVENCYLRAVREKGNQKALKIMENVLEPSDEVWRALGTLPESGLKLRKSYQRFNAEEVFKLPAITDQDQPGCLCGKVILGKVNPPECTLFGEVCTPDHPIGPCMVSSEGTCAAYLRYGDN
jgi:hydrogenase expression/formation protein HypD